MCLEMLGPGESDKTDTGSQRFSFNEAILIQSTFIKPQPSGWPRAAFHGHPGCGSAEAQGGSAALLSSASAWQRWPSELDPAGW